jgi:MSHA pilin protein MshD
MLGRVRRGLCPRRARWQAGIALFEVILAIVVISIAVTAVMGVFTLTVRHSVDPMTRQQAQFIAEAYLEEILLKNFADPDPPNNICTGTQEALGRAYYDNVCDYNGINEAPKNQFGQAIAALGAYNVQVAIISDNTVNLNGLINNTGAPIAYRVLRVDVTVTGPNNASITLSGFRTNYNCDANGQPGCRNL